MEAVYNEAVNKKIETLKQMLEAVKQRMNTMNVREFYSELAKQTNPCMQPRHRKYFAKSISEINISKIEPILIFCETDEQKALFRSAMSFWSVPVSEGFGRRINVIIFDRGNHKVMGVVGFADPVIQLSVRDRHIGWSKNQRLERLYNMLSAYLLGAVPPYNSLFGGKLVALLSGSREITDYFHRKYQNAETNIRKRKPLPFLISIDTMGAFGQSAVYHQLMEWKFLGYTAGYSHFQFSNEFWDLVYDISREFKLIDSCLWDFQQSNRKMTILVKLFDRLGINRSFLLSIQRGYYFRPLIQNWREFLLGQTNEAVYINKTASEYIQYWKTRWLPKAIRKLHTASTIAV